MSLAQEITDVLNRHSAENGSNTPDFILAIYLMKCLDAFDAATRERESWYGIWNAPGETRARSRAPEVPSRE